MATQIIPFFTEFPNFSEQITLDNEVFRFDFTFNERAEQWNMSIFTVDGTPLIYGIKLVLGYPLLDQWVGRGLPPGELVILDTTGNEVGVTRDNLGTILQLGYIPEDEVLG